MAELTITDVIQKCTDLKKFWSVRNKKFKDWYNILRLEDEMLEDNKESFVSNRPRTFFNLSLHLLDSPTIPHRYPVEGLTNAEIEATSKMEAIIKLMWKNVNKQYKGMGRQSATRQLASNILAFGWYAAYMGIDDDGPQLEVWHPADVFPCFTEYGLMEVAHIFTVPNKVAKRVYKMAGIEMGYATAGDVTIYDYWFIDDDGNVSHAVCNSAKNWIIPPEKRTDLLAIPVTVGPVGGLPDMGQLDKKWQEHCGEAIVAVNAELYRNYNRVKSFLQQATRDGTEPKWFERSTGTEILTSENLSVAGAIFRGGPMDSVEPVAYPPIPVELTQNIFSYEQEIQEGSFSSMMFGSVQVQIAAYTLSQMAQSAQQVLRPYHESFQGALECIDNFWTYQMQVHKYKPLGKKAPKVPDVDIEVDYPIHIPGDLVNRATVAKMLSPNMEFSPETVMDMLFPAEIPNPVAETAKSRAARAMNSEESLMVDKIVGFREAAELARKGGSREMERLYNAVADRMEGQLLAQPKQTVPPPSGGGGAPLGIEQAGGPATPPGVA